MSQTTLRSVHLSDDGTITGGKNLGVDGTLGGAGAKTFFVTAPGLSGDPTATGFKSFHVERIMLRIEDGPSFTTTTFGGISGPLTNGVKLDVVSSNTVDLLNGKPWVSNGQIAAVMFDIARDAWGSGALQLRGRWTFDKFENDGVGIILEGTDKLQATVQDNLSTLDEFTIIAQGVYR